MPAAEPKSARKPILFVVAILGFGDRKRRVADREFQAVGIASFRVAIAGAGGIAVEDGEICLPGRWT